MSNKLATPAAAPLPAASLRVLAVDDSPTNRQIIAAFLNRLGHHVVLAEDGAQAVAAFAREPFDLVLMDVVMPVLDGFDATRRIKALCGERWVPVVFLSALDQDKSLVAGLDAGGDGYLAKPVDFVLLQATLRSLQRTIDAHRRLVEAHLWQQAVTDTIIDALITIDATAIIRSVNPAAVRMFGYARDELIGRNVNMLMPEPWRSEHDGYVRRYVEGGAPHIIGVGQRNVEGVRKDGTVFPVEFGVGEARVDGERLFIGILRDVTKRRQAERRLGDALVRLQTWNEKHENENALAAAILSRQLTRSGLADPALATWVAPADVVSGDVVAAARAPGGELCVMLADPTGHGLAASISTLPVLTLFYEMVDWGMALSAIISRINSQLCQALPPSRFVAAAFVSIDLRQGRAEVWSGGLPPILLLAADGAAEHVIESRHLPLGIVAFDGDMASTETVPIAAGNQFALVSDGLIEATNEATGEAFGMARLRATLASTPAGGRLAAVQAVLDQHLGESLPHDDVTLVLVNVG